MSNKFDIAMMYLGYFALGYFGAKIVIGLFSLLGS